MRSKQDIQEALRAICADERLSQSCVTIYENAPLAIIQLSLESARDILKWVLEDTQ